MSRLKIMVIYGTRPEAIKLSPVITSLSQNLHFQTVVVSTGQHREMVDSISKMFGFAPDYSLQAMVPGQSLNQMLASLIRKIDEVISIEKPDCVLVQGDTTTAAAGALSSFNCEIPVVHLEAGLRTGDIMAPFPEEANRRIITQVATLHLTPTIGAKENLTRENVDPSSIVVTGNTVIDALLQATGWDVEISDAAVQRVLDRFEQIVIVTTHRRENLHDIQNIAHAVKKIAMDNQNVGFIVPLHLNPRVREAFLPEVRSVGNIAVARPLPYDEFTAVLKNADLVLTDSGGLQEEAPALGIPVLIMRDKTERPEAIRAGTSRIIGTGESEIVKATNGMLRDLARDKERVRPSNPFGDGNATARVVAAIEELFGVGIRLADFE